MRESLGFAVLCALLLAPCLDAAEPTPSEQEAVQAFREGNISRAVPLYRQALTETADAAHRARLHACIAWLLFADGRTDEVATHLQAAMFEDPGITLERSFYTPEFLEIFDSLRRGGAGRGVPPGGLAPDLEATIRSIEERLSDGVDLEGALADVNRLAAAYPDDPRPDRLRLDLTRRLSGRLGPPPVSLELPPGPVGYWAFDEGRGAAARCQSGAASAVEVHGASWVAGRSGFGLLVEPDGGHALIPPGPPLDRLQAGSYTISVWFRPLSVPGPGSSSDDDQFGLVIKPGYHEGLTYRSDRRFSMQHWLAGNRFHGVFSTSTFEPGRFYHLVGVVDRSVGSTLLYVDGRLEGSRTWPAGAPARDFGPTPWTVGVANPEARRWRWQAHGVVDELTMWDRALTGDEIASLTATSAGDS
jgi:hypothetical protein